MQVTISKLPTNLSEFKTLASSGREPERVCALFLYALFLFDRNKDDGTAAMNLLRGPRPMTPYDVQFLRDLLPGTKRFGELKSPWAIEGPDRSAPGYGGKRSCSP